MSLRGRFCPEQSPSWCGRIAQQKNGSLYLEKKMSTASKSEILTLVELVNYQDAAVVSRQITKAEAGNVTLFAFDKDQGLSEHTAPFDALVHILEGDAQVTISGKSFDLKTGDAIIMPANEPHALKAVQRFKMLLTMIRA
jgi:quercetin dioxygenase-like cupin family protein